MSLAAKQAPLLWQVMSSSYKIAHKAGEIIRDIMKAGDLGVVLKEQVNSAYMYSRQYYFGYFQKLLTYMYLQNRSVFGQPLFNNRKTHFSHETR